MEKKLIVAATDFSPVANNAVNYAADMARDIDAGLLLLNVYNIPVHYSDGVLVTPFEELKAQSEEALEKLRTEIYQRTEGKLHIYVMSRLGDITEELSALCHSKQPFAVVIGTQGITSSEKQVFGSSMLSIIRSLAYPVICVPPGAQYGKGIQQAGFACDFHDVALTVPVKSIKDFIREFNPMLHILNIENMDKRTKPGHAEDSTTLHRLFDDLKPQYHYIESAAVEKGLTKFVADHDLGILITVPRRHNLFEKLFQKQTTKALARETTTPLVCIHG